MKSRRKPITYVITEGGCHECTSHTPSNYGYPKLWWKGVGRHMHRVLYQEAFGELPESTVVRHTCDNRLCINLDHLVPGTPGETAEDRNSRDRNNPPIGERSGTSKLTEAGVLEIRQSEENQLTLAKRFGVHQSQISRIRSGKRWAHLREE